MKKITIAIVLIFLFVASLVLTYFLSQASKELFEIKTQLGSLQAELVLENDKSAQLQAALEEKDGQLTSATEALNSTREQLRFAQQKIAKLQKASSSLFKQREELQKKINSLEGKKLALEVKLHSVPELKKAIIQAKIENIERKIKEYRAKRELKQQLQKEIDEQKLRLGNRGMLVKEGKSTFKPTIRIEVRPEK